MHLQVEFRHHEIPQSHQLAPTIAEIKQAVIQSYAIEEQDLKQSKRGQLNEPRNLSKKTDRLELKGARGRIRADKVQHGKQYCCQNGSSAVPG